MKIDRKSVVAFLLPLVGLILAACGQTFENIPPGFKGKILSPSGYTGNWIASGQVDIGMVDASHQGNKLVLLETTGKQIKESFLGVAANADHEDHRILTQDGVPVSVDVRARLLLAQDQSTWDDILVQVTPKPTGNPRVLEITLDMVYERFCQMDMRGGIRDVFQKKESYKVVVRDMATVNAEIAKVAIDSTRNNKSPLLIQDVQLSNVKPDPTVFDALSRLEAAQAEADKIEKICSVIRKYREEYELLGKYQAIPQAWREVAETADKNGTRLLIIGMPEGGQRWTAPAALQNLPPEKK